MAETKKKAVATKSTAKSTSSKPTSSKTVKKPASKPAAKPVAKKATEVKSVKVNVQKDTKVKKVEFSADLPKNLFGSEKIYTQAIFDSILSERASRRQGTHQVKNRAEVSGSGKKPWRQKGTGRARHSSMRSPIWVGGGRAFGPQSNKNYSLKVNKKVKYAAFVSALTLLANDKAVLVNDLSLSQIKTKDLVQKLVELKVNDLRHVLVVNENPIVFRSSQNLGNVNVVKANSVTVENLIGADVMIISNESLEILKERGR
ncbi:50S ribosomal protein L4 [Mycoplasmopsis canis PG 14]|uniref:Large ribosomal subunit protein uL4 n=1 Tax=Mycoplasmopsis canis TaxID=29555 RepID=A0A0F6SYE0_9BACT|nr:50S ribosomal protein L4 [Mycoplasmopsis canis]AKF41345.1 50S ribosomal protein L4 [Mycoplasmopsis canis]AMD81461.1 50S ribosomal protein L4 [Mycoplasmopsis canis PG 14]EIE39518.1 50S ribosomal protein L4 [Mycoplasmopsis canis PG 14]VEU69091.1 50S ribosomal protein L4 [Mycoplasmopsis canis]